MINNIINQVTLNTAVTFEQMCTPTRSKPIILAKHLVFYFVYYYTKIPLQHVATIFGMDDHASVIHGAKKIYNELMYKDMKQRVDVISGQLGLKLNHLNRQKQIA